jgi:hypothetical protein
MLARACTTRRPGRRGSARAEVMSPGPGGVAVGAESFLFSRHSGSNFSSKVASSATFCHDRSLAMERAMSEDLKNRLKNIESRLDDIDHHLNCDGYVLKAVFAALATNKEIVRKVIENLKSLEETFVIINRPESTISELRNAQNFFALLLSPPIEIEHPITREITH